jgi:ribonuclease HII
MLICGVDEAGRGPLAGDEFAAAVILPDDYDLPNLRDSKKLSAKQRETLYYEIRSVAVAYAVATASVAEIDTHNILHATMLAMNRAIAALDPQAELALIDGNYNAEIAIPSRTIINGDATEPAISAASILAKVERDRYMLKVAELYPNYAFERHKGYGTKLHYERLREHGASPVHRRSFLKKSGGQWGEVIDDAVLNDAKNLTSAS